MLERIGAFFRPRATLTLREPIREAQPFYRQAAIYEFFNWLGGIPDPDEVLKRTGKTRADLRAILRDAEVSQALDTRREAVLATPWRLEGGSSARRARFIETELTPHIPDLVSALWQAVPYGYSVVEVVYARRQGVGGPVGVASVHEPPFEWFRPQPDGSLRFFPEDGRGGVDGIACDPRKFLLTTRGGTYRNPYGEALLSPLYWPVTWRMQGWQLWLEFLETFGQPVVIAQTSAYNQFIEAMQQQGVKRAVGWQATGPSDKIDTITASTAGEFERLQSALDRTIQRCVLGQTLTSDVGKTGSYAAAKVHNEVREDKRRADVRIVTESMQSLVDTLWSLNGFPGDPPQFLMQDDVGLETERAERDAILAEKLGLRFKDEYIVERYDLEAGDFEIAEPEPVDAEPSAGDEDDDMAEDQDEETRAAAIATIRAAAQRFTKAQRVIEQGVAGLATRDRKPIPLSKIRSAIMAARDATDLHDRLAVLFNERDPGFAELVARARFAAAVIGYVHAAEEADPPRN